MRILYEQILRMDKNGLSNVGLRLTTNQKGTEELIYSIQDGKIN